MANTKPTKKRSTIWYEIIVVQDGATRDVQVRGNLEGAKRMVDTLKVSWPNADLISVRRHSSGRGYVVLHKLTYKGVLQQMVEEYEDV